MAPDPRAIIRVVGLAVRWVTALCGVASALEPGEQSPSPDQPVSSGPFTPEQAARGQAVYARSCSACHGATLTGGSAPPLTGPAFEASWSDPRVTLDDIFFIQRTTMPPRASATVSPDDHAAVFAYLLQVNGYAAGTTPVSAGAPGLVRPPRWAAAAPAAATRLAPTPHPSSSRATRTPHRRPPVPTRPR